MRLEEFKAACFDLDGTLVEEVSSWITVHRHYHTEEKARVNLASYSGGLIDYDEFMRRDISLWPRPLRLSKIDEILSSFHLRSGARELVNFLSTQLSCMILSAGIDILAKKVADSVGILTYFANGLETDDFGYLTGNGVKRVELNRKDVALTALLSAQDIRSRDCIVVGDSPYDRRLFDAAGYSVAISRTEHFGAKQRFSNLEELLHWFGEGG